MPACYCGGLRLQQCPQPPWPAIFASLLPQCLSRSHKVVAAPASRSKPLARHAAAPRLVGPHAARPSHQPVAAAALRSRLSARRLVGPLAARPSSPCNARSRPSPARPRSACRSTPPLHRRQQSRHRRRWCRTKGASSGRHKAAWWAARARSLTAASTSNQAWMRGSSQVRQGGACFWGPGKGDVAGRAHASRGA